MCCDFTSCFRNPVWRGDFHLQARQSTEKHCRTEDNCCTLFSWKFKERFLAMKTPPSFKQTTIRLVDLLLYCIYLWCSIFIHTIILSEKGHLVLCMMVGKKWPNAGIKSEVVYQLNCLCHTLGVSERCHSHAKWPRVCYKSVSSKRMYKMLYSKYRCCTRSLALETKGKCQKSLLNSSLALKSLYLQNPFKNLLGLKLS